ncbi:MAG: hypothetical protein RLZZ449_760, partial [Actinomycetota bacterium]
AQALAARGLVEAGLQSLRVRGARLRTQGAQIERHRIHLDPTTEQNIIRRLREKNDLSCLIVASRPSTVAVATKVVHIEHGVIQDIGAHEDLLRRSDDYRLLIESYESDRKSHE